MKNKLVLARVFVAEHKVAVTVAATSIVWGGIYVARARVVNEFLDKHNLSDEFYQMNVDN